MARRPRRIPNKDIEARAAAIVKDEKIRWELSTAFVTERVAFKMRPLVRMLRKNYYGVFDQPIDPHTGQEKVWYPITEINVEAVVKNIDLDQKDINFKAKNPNGYAVTDLLRAYTKDELTKMGFGQMLDDFERQLAIDGTAVWKTYEENGQIKVVPVDLLNIYIDPTSPSIQDSYRFTERSLMFPEEIKRMSGWTNTDGIEQNVTEGLPRTDPLYMNRSAQMTSNVRMLDVYELWGKIPKSLITGNQNDDTEEVEGHLVVSGIDTPGRERCHLIEVNNRKTPDGLILKPYEEAWYTRVPNRWYGRGIAEKLLMLQVYANIIFNVRINRSRVSQLGLFKIKKNSGITPQMLARLPSNGAVVLNDMQDLEQLVIQEVGAASYKDEDVINALSERLTNAFEVVTGEPMPSSTPATNAAIQNTNAKSGFVMIKDGIGYFLRRWLDRHALPILIKQLTPGDLIRFDTDSDEAQGIIQTIVNYRAHEALSKYYERGIVPTPQQLSEAMDQATRQLSQKGQFFIELEKSLVSDDVFTDILITNEEMDVAVTLQNLIAMMHVAPQYQDALVKETFDLMGLGQPPAQQQPQQAVQAPPALEAPYAQPMGGPLQAQQLQALTTQANVTR